MMYGTSKDFLLQFGLKDLSELPSVEDFHDLSGGDWSSVTHFYVRHTSGSSDQVAKTPPALAAWGFNFTLRELICQIRSFDCQRVKLDLE